MRNMNIYILLMLIRFILFSMCIMVLVFTIPIKNIMLMMFGMSIMFTMFIMFFIFVVFDMFVMLFLYLFLQVWTLSRSCRSCRCTSMIELCFLLSVHCSSDYELLCSLPFLNGHNAKLKRGIWISKDISVNKIKGEPTGILWASK